MCRGYQSSYDRICLKDFYQHVLRAIDKVLRANLTVIDRYRINLIGRKLGALSVSERTQEDGVYLKQEWKELTYQFPQDYIPRTCHLAGTVKELSRFQDMELLGEHLTLEQVCRNFPFVILLGDAGCGKTIELKQVAAVFSADAQLPRPLFVQLKQYGRKTLKELVGEEHIPPEGERRFFVIDGFDEISGQDRKHFLQEISLYREEQPETSFLISSRGNFYYEKVFGEDFAAVWLEPLRKEQIQEYVAGRGVHWEAFWNEVLEKEQQELIQIPFYLVELCEIYQEMNGFPKRTELMHKLIERKFSQDLGKFRMTDDQDLNNNRELLFELLRKVAVSLQCMNSISLEDRDYQKLVEDPEKRALMSYSGIWKKEAGQWMFVHNNFREYLAAEYLKELPLEEKQYLITAGYPELETCEHWNHVLSYLFSMDGLPDQQVLQSWVRERDFTVFLRVDRDRLSESLRTDIFKQEFERLKAQVAWITDQNYQVEALVSFGLSYGSVSYLLQELEKPEHTVSQWNAIIAITELPHLFGREKEVKEALLRVVLDSRTSEREICYGIRALAELKLLTEKDLEYLICTMEERKSSYVRYGLYIAVDKLGKADYFVEFLLNGIDLLDFRDESRIGNEAFLLQKLLKTITEETSIKKLIQYLGNQDSYVIGIGMEEMVEYAVSQAEEQFCSIKDPLWEVMVRAYKKQYNKNTEIAQGVLEYFSRTNTTVELALWAGEYVKENGGKSGWLLRDILDENTAELLLHRYEAGEISDAFIELCLGVMRVRSQHYLPIVKLYTRRTKRKMRALETVDYLVMETQGRDRYKQALADKEQYLALIEEMINLGGNQDWSIDDLKNYPREICEKRPEFRDLHMDYRRTHKGMTVKEWKTWLDKNGWEEVSAILIKFWLQEHRNEEPTREMSDCAKRYVQQHVDEVDLSNACVQGGHIDSAKKFEKLRRIVYFIMRFSLPLSKKKAKELSCLGMFSDYITWKSTLLQYLTEDELREQVIQNLNGKVLWGTVAEYHITYCLEYQIRECAEPIIQIAKDSERKGSARRQAVKYTCWLMGVDECSKTILPLLDGEYFFEAVMELWDKPEAGKQLADAVWDYRRRDHGAKWKWDWYACLVHLQDKRGLRAFRKELETMHKAPERQTYLDPVEELKKIRNAGLLQEVEKLTELAFGEGFQDWEIGGVKSCLIPALIAIACSGPQEQTRVLEFLDKMAVQYESELWKKACFKKCSTDIRRQYRNKLQERWNMKAVKKWLWNGCPLQYGQPFHQNL